MPLGRRVYLSVVIHFQVLWGYFSAGLSTERYERQLDAEEAAWMKPKRDDLLDAHIAACVKRHDASIWTSDGEFLKFFPEAKVTLV